MFVLVPIAFGAGIVTAVSPCVFPVLPILFAGGATGGRRRPYAIIAGLVTSFATFTLIATWLLRQLHLPQDFLRNLSIGLLFLVAASLIFPRVGVWIERPLARLSRRSPNSDLGGGFLLGASLGLVFVPCGGPIIGAISANAARVHLGWQTVAITLAYALGAALPMLAIAALDQSREVGAALLASAEGYTPRANQLIDAARERLGTIQEVANALADNLPAPKAAGSRSRRRRRKRKKKGQAQGQSQQQKQSQNGPKPAADKPERKTAPAAEA